MSFKSKLMFASVAIAAFAFTVSAMAQPGGGGRRGGMGFGGGGQNSLMLLMNERVQQELDLVDDQVKDLEGLQEEARNTMRDMFQEMRDSGGDFESMRDKIQEKMKVFEADVNEILLPEQRSRLKQLSVQMQSRGFGGAGSGLLQNEDLKKELGITSEQEEKMREQIEKAQEMVREEMTKLQKKAMDQVLSVLSSEQRKQYEDMVGETFDFGQGGGFGGRGGPGGAGGPGGRGGQGGRGGGGQSDF